MSTITAAVPLDRAAITLLDPSHVAWTAAELLDYFNSAQRLITQLKADAYTVLGPIPLVAGVDQELPAGGLTVVNLHRNRVTGRIVHQVGSDLMNAWNPEWPAETEQTDVVNWIADQRQPFRFQVYPPNDGTGVLTGVYGSTPAVVTVPTQTFSLVDSYEPALYQGVLYYAYSKNSRRQDLQNAAAALQAMNAMVTGKTATVKLNAPDLKVAEQDQS